MPRGGFRPNSGRKSDSEYARIRALVDSCVSDADWISLVKALVRAAKKGDARAFKELRETRFGLLSQDVSMSAEGGVFVMNLPDNGMDATQGTANAVPRVERVRGSVRRRGGRREK